MIRYLVPIVVLVVLVVLVALVAAAGGALGALSATGDGDGPALSPPAVRQQGADETQAVPAQSPRVGPYVGLTLTERRAQVVVTAVATDSPADNAGVQEGDVIEAVDGDDVGSAADIASILGRHDPGDSLTFELQRDGEGIAIDVTVGERPAPFEVPDDVPPLFPRDGPPQLLPFGDLLDLFDRPFDRFVSGEITVLDEDGEPVSWRLAAGTVDPASSEHVLVLNTNGDEKLRFGITEETRVRRGLRAASADDLEPGTRVFVVGHQDGSALAIVAEPR